MLLWLVALLIVALLYADRGHAPDRVEASQFFHNPASVPVTPVIKVLGAAVFPDGTLSPVLRGRVDAGLLLYKMHKVQKLS